MQIFVLDYNPKIAAENLADIHIVKMCLETAQILSAIIILKGKRLINEMPKPLNLKHPVITSIIDSQPTINWVVCYNSWLQKEYEKRYHKRHMYYKLADIYIFDLFKPTPNSNCCDLTFARDFKGFKTNKQDIVQAYRDYYKFKKKTLKRWKYTNSVEPNWLKE